MGDIVISDVAKDLIINIINIIILFVIVRALVYKPVKKFLDNRTDKINKINQEAEKNREDAKTEAQKYHDLIEQSEDKRDQIIRDAEREANQNAGKIIENAKKSAAEITENARSNAQKERETIIASMKEDITGLAFDISKRMLSREVSDSDNKKIADDFFTNSR